LSTWVHFLFPLMLGSWSQFLPSISMATSRQYLHFPSYLILPFPIPVGTLRLSFILPSNNSHNEVVFSVPILWWEYWGLFHDGNAESISEDTMYSNWKWILMFPSHTRNQYLSFFLFTLGEENWGNLYYSHFSMEILSHSWLFPFMQKWESWWNINIFRLKWRQWNLKLHQQRASSWVSIFSYQIHDILRE